jgi:putative PIN family toxin of toxin-antitoxin system
VIDTNTIISRLLLPNSVPAEAVRYVLNNGKLLISDSTLIELSKVILRDKFNKYVSLEARKLFIDGLRTIGLHINIEGTIRICRDPKDNMFLELAVNGQADIIISGDQDLLVLKEIEGIKIISPKEFLEYVKENSKCH